MNWLDRDTPARLRFVSDCRGFVISAMKPCDGIEPWWEAKDANRKDVAAGYSNDGLAKCKRYCELAASAPAEPHVEPTISECRRVVIQAPSVPLSEPIPQPSLF